jgi:hypothetical protein
MGGRKRMKNIYILSTNKPSRLHNTFNFLRLESGFDLSPYNQHIYITSDEEIKEGDWVFDGDNPYKWTKDDVEDCLYNPGAKNYKGCKKIIMTTDQDLIKEGVQAIDDDFLEWFVENPSCEFVPIIITTINNESLYKTNIGFESWRKEVQKQHLIDIMRGDEELGLYKEPKQETLEEFIENGGYPTGYTQEIWEDGVRLGAKWQQERMYSEEDMKQFAWECVANFLSNNDNEVEMALVEVIIDRNSKQFEQFKKK